MIKVATQSQFALSALAFATLLPLKLLLNLKGLLQCGTNLLLQKSSRS